MLVRVVVRVVWFILVRGAVLGGRLYWFERFLGICSFVVLFRIGGYRYLLSVMFLRFWAYSRFRSLVISFFSSRISLLLGFSLMTAL